MNTCKKGHEKTVENTYTRLNGRKQCRVCMRECERRRYRTGRVNRSVYYTSGQFLKDLRKRRKAAGICIQCNEPNDRPKLLRCRSCEEKNKVGQKSWQRWLHSYKTKCSQCDETYPYCLDFHHIDPTTKVFNIGHARQHTHSKEAIMLEMQKCVILCANCHRKKTHPQLP